MRFFLRQSLAQIGKISIPKFGKFGFPSFGCGGNFSSVGQEQMDEMKERLDELKEMKDMMCLSKTIDNPGGQ